MTGGTLVLTRQNVVNILTLDDCIHAVEEAFRRHGRGEIGEPGILGMHVEGGGFHVKAAAMGGHRPYFAAKLNANFPGNRTRGLPTIQGVIALFDAADGRLLALIDSIEITILRTGAATAVAARYLSRPVRSVVTIAGCGNQGRVSLRALARVRDIESAFVWDVDSERARTCAADLSSVISRAVTPTDDLCAAARLSDIIVTCTPSTEPVLGPDAVRAGALVAAVGADSEHKQEIHPALMARAVVITDVTAQCATIGDLHHALSAGSVSLDHVRAQLGEVVAGVRPGRTREDEVVVFDSTGTALQDVAVAALVYECALATSSGTTLMLQ
ncbi:MAG: ornithine cyclodeaminase family protein [Acidobacteria bacterium]|nr:ornithine cyclodeaminase family protein [Acidobacteriota bacterium]MCA1651463.1 ornithine cyclodeaminase family protein [Acidobacteriota bacterium]